MKTSPKAQATQISKKKIIRQERLRGSTERAIYISTLPNNTKKKEREIDSYRAMYIDRYIKDGYRIKGKIRSLAEFSEYLGISLRDIIKTMTKGSNVLLNEQKSSFLGLLSLGLKNGLEDRAYAMNQLELLLASQGGEYQPFISSTVNDAIRGLMTSNKTFLELAKLLQPTASQLTINNTQVANTGVINGISPNEAVKLIENNSHIDLLQQPYRQAKLLQPYEAGLPEIIAYKQQGFSMAAEGQMISKIKKHDVRREQDGDIIPID